MGADGLRDALQDVGDSLGNLPLAKTPPGQWYQFDTDAILRRPIPTVSFGVLGNDTTVDFEGQGSWYAGHTNDLLLTTNNRVLAASRGGGVWELGPWFDYDDVPINLAFASPLGDFAHPTVTCLAQGPLGPNHIYAGGVELHETIVYLPNVDPFDYWYSVPLPADVAIIYKVAVATKPPALVISTNAGVYWSPMQPYGYQWQRAVGLPTQKNGQNVAAYGLAVGWSGQSQRVLVSIWPKPASDVPGIAANGGLYVGTWQGNTLSFSLASLNWNLQTPVFADWGAATIAVCSTTNPSVAYAVLCASGFPTFGGPCCPGEVCCEEGNGCGVVLECREGSLTANGQTWGNCGADAGSGD